MNRVMYCRPPFLSRARRESLRNMVLVVLFETISSLFISIKGSKNEFVRNHCTFRYFTHITAIGEAR